MSECLDVELIGRWGLLKSHSAGKSPCLLPSTKMTTTNSWTGLWAKHILGKNIFFSMNRYTFQRRPEMTQTSSMLPYISFPPANFSMTSNHAPPLVPFLRDVRIEWASQVQALEQLSSYSLSHLLVRLLKETQNGSGLVIYPHPIYTVYASEI